MANPPSSLDDILLSLREEYLESLSLKCYQLENLLINVVGETRNSETFTELFRLVHSIKGAGGTFGLPLVSVLCHRLEDALADEQRERFDELFLTRALALVDILQQITKLGATAEPSALAALEEKAAALWTTSADQAAKVMLLEASKMMGQMVQSVLESMHMHVTLKHDGLDALERLLHESFDLLIVSVELTRLRGPALLSALQLNNGLNAHTPAILLTSHKTIQLGDLRGVNVVTRSPKLVEELPTHVRASLSGTQCKKAERKHSKNNK